MVSTTIIGIVISVMWSSLWCGTIV